jgi:hypothetical protein
MPLYTSSTVESRSLWRRGLRLSLLLALAGLYGVAIAYLPPQLVALPIVPIVILLLLSLWMLPDRASFPERALMNSFNWFIVLYYLWPSYIAIAIPGLPWFSAGRIGLLVLLLVALYCFSVSSVLRHQVLDTVQSSRVIWTLFLISLVTQLVSLGFTRSVIITVPKFLNNQAYWTLPFLVACYIFKQPNRISKFVRLLIGIVLTLCIIGFFEHAQKKLFWEGHIPSFLKVDSNYVLDTVYSSQMREYIGIYRVHTTFIVSLIYAELLALVLPFVLHWMICARTAKLRIVMIIAWFMIVPNIMFTDTRLGKIGLIIAHVGYALIWAVRARQRIASFATNATLAAIPIIAAMAIGVIFASHTLHMMVFGSEGYAGSTDARYDQLALGIPKVLHNPLGYGSGMAGLVLDYHSPGGLLTIDSQFLKTALESGVIGMFATYGLTTWAALQAFKIFFSAQDEEAELAGPLAISLINYFVIKSVLAEDYNNTLGYIFVAIVAALMARYRVSLPQSSGNPTRVLRSKAA